MNLMKYALNSSTLKTFWRGMPDSKMLSLWFLHRAFRVVKLQASLGPHWFDVLVLEFIKQKHTLRILLYQEEMFLLLGLDYCTVALLQ